MKNQHITARTLEHQLIDDNLVRPLVMGILGIKPTCRACGADLSEVSRRSLMAGKRVKCSAGCGWYGTWRDNTLLSGSRISCLQFLALFFRYTLPEDVPTLADHLHVTTDTVRFWRDRIQQHIS